MLLLLPPPLLLLVPPPPLPPAPAAVAAAGAGAAGAGAGAGADAGATGAAGAGAGAAGTAAGGGGKQNCAQVCVHNHLTCVVDDFELYAQDKEALAECKRGHYCSKLALVFPGIEPSHTKGKCCNCTEDNRDDSPDCC